MIMRYWILILCVVCLPCVAKEFPSLGISANTVMSPAEEQELGEAFIRQLRRQVEVIDDLQINNYLNGLGQLLASYSDNPGQPFRFFVIKDSSINAFAVPGGFVGVNSGLILKSRSESELASVLSHEIAHVTQRHIARTTEASKRISLPAMAAAIVAAILIGGPQAGEAAMAVMTAGKIQMLINFTRAHEKEADRVGMQTLAKSGFDPRDMPSFFERLQASSRYNDRGVPEFLRTHPVTTDRIAEARSRAEKYPLWSAKGTPHYHLTKAQLLVLTNENKPKLLKRLQKMLVDGNYRDERAIRYAVANTLLILRKTSGVQTQINWLLKNDGDRVIYRLVNAQLALLQNEHAKAMRIYEQALQVYPGDNILGLDYAEKLLQNNAAKKAKTVLLKISDTKNPDYYRLLAQAYQLTGAKAQAHLALAEKHYLMGQTKLALEQLKLARKDKSLDFYSASRIEARYKELKEEWLEEQKL